MVARITLALLVFFVATHAAMANGKMLTLNAGYQWARAVQTFPDPLFIGETDYIASDANQFRIGAEFIGFFVPRFSLNYQGLAVQSHSEQRHAATYRISGYYSSYLSAMAAYDAGIFRWHYGFAALVTFGTRSFADPSLTILSERAIDTRLSQAYPAGGFTLFPLAPIRFSMIFLNGDANLLYGWLRLQTEFETEDHIFMPAFELLNHASFGKGIPNFVQPPGAVNLGYAYKLADLKFVARLGFVLNPKQGFENARVSFGDRLLFEFSIAWRMRPHE